MVVQFQKRLFTVQDYHRMSEAGIFAAGDRLELIEGEILTMSPIGTHHAATVDRLARLLSQLPENQAIFRVQSPIHLSDRTEPQPDLTLLQPRADYYAHAHPTPSDVLLLIEVADSTISYDRDIKIPLYARANIPEVWLVDLTESCLEVYRQPTLKGYSFIQKFWQNQTVSPLAFPELVVNLATFNHRDSR